MVEDGAVQGTVAGGMTSGQAWLVVAVIAVVGILVGAAVYSGYSNHAERNGGDTISIVASFYPLGFFSREIGGDHVEVTTLIPDNTELHGWEPSPSDVVAADKADILVYNGAGLDHWFEHDVLGSIDLGDAIVVETAPGELLLDAMHDEHDEGDEQEHDHGDVDPHTWLSPYVAKYQAESIYDALVLKDPGNESDYAANWDALKARFETLDTAFARRLNDTVHDEILVTHSAFGYYAHRYGFEQHGVIGLSADEQPSAQAISALADSMVEHGIDTIFVDPVYSTEYADTLKAEVEGQTGQPVRILKLYMMTGELDGLDYFGQQQANLEALAAGLGAVQ